MRLAELQLAPCLKGDQVRVVVDSANAPAGFAAELAQVTQPCTAGGHWHVWLLLVAQRAGTSLVDWCQQEARQPYPALLHRLAGAVTLTVAHRPCLPKQCRSLYCCGHCRFRRMSTF